MECKHAMNVIQAALDAGREFHPSERVRRHLAACPRCRLAWQEMQTIEIGLRDLGQAARPEPSAGLHPRIMAALAAEPATAPARVRHRVPRTLSLATAASFLLLLVVSWTLMHHSEPPLPTQETASGFSVPTITLDPSVIDFTALIETPKQDFLELADSLLVSTGVTDDGIFARSAEIPPPIPTPL